MVRIGLILWFLNGTSFSVFWWPCDFLNTGHKVDKCRKQIFLLPQILQVFLFIVVAFLITIGYACAGDQSEM